MILPRTGLAEATTLAERVRGQVASIDDRRRSTVTMSIGVAAFPESAHDSDGVLGAADAALLRAKARGRDRVCLFGEDTRRGRGELEGDLVALGRRFAAFIGLSEAETAGLVTALAVHETGGAVQDEVQAILRQQRTSGDAAAARGARRRPSRRSCTATSAGTAPATPRDGAAAPSRASPAPSPSAARYDVAAHNGDSVVDAAREAAQRARPAHGAALRGDAARREGGAQLALLRDGCPLPPACAWCARPTCGILAAWTTSARCARRSSASRRRARTRRRVIVAVVVAVVVVLLALSGRLARLLRRLAVVRRGRLPRRSSGRASGRRCCSALAAFARVLRHRRRQRRDRAAPGARLPRRRERGVLEPRSDARAPYVAARRPGS